MNEVEGRLAAVGAALAALEVEAIVITQEHNRRYLTGFSGSAGIVVVTPGSARLLADTRYYEQAAEEATAYEVVKVTSRYQDTLASTLGELGVQQAAFEAEHLTVAELGRWQEGMPGIGWHSSSGVVEALRAVKSDSELAAIRRAAVLADSAMAHVEATARPGMTERALAWEIERFLRQNGAEGLAFPPIVAAGENSALPHHSPGERVIGAGEPIVVDLGARVDGYHSDLTRTFSIGPARDPDYEAVYAIVLDANRLATAGIRAGLGGVAADALARDHIASAGYGEAFGHSLGHGVGLNVHEGPRLSFVPPETTLVAGNVVTIEPGIYLPGRFGVRIEDLAVVGDAGVDVLSQAPRAALLALA
jgi:Xaa-Pro aminopeptidase